MSIEIIVSYLNKYGLVFIFGIVFLEHIHCPGVPATVVMPTIGAFVAKYNGSLTLVIFISIIAGVLGSIVLYIMGYHLGNPIIEWFNKKFPKTEKYVSKIIDISEEYGNRAIFLCRLIPMVRILISLVSGVLKSKFSQFVIYSTMGICIWNTALISFGYFGVGAMMR